MMRQWDEDDKCRQAELSRRPYSKLHSVLALRDDDPKYKAVDAPAQFYTPKPRKWPWALTLVGIIAAITLAFLIVATGGF